MDLFTHGWQRAGLIAARSVARWRSHGIDRSAQLSRTAPVGVLVGFGLMGFGTAWDIQWHATVGPGSPWMAPHLVVYSGIILVATLGSAMVAKFHARGRSLWSDPYGLVWIGSCTMVAAAVIDAIWHRMIGDRTLWSPPHVLGVSGALIIGFGGIIAWRQASRHRVFPAPLCRLAETLLLAGYIVASYFGLRAPVILAFRPEFHMPPFLLATSPYIVAGLAGMMLPAIVLWCRGLLGIWWVDVVAIGAVTIWIAQEILHRLLTPWVAGQYGTVMMLSRAPDVWFGLLTLGFILGPALVVNHAALRSAVLSGMVMAGLYVAAVIVWLVLIGHATPVSPALVGAIMGLGGLSGWAGGACAGWMRRLSDPGPAWRTSLRTNPIPGEVSRG
jgi:hypothetical protein